MLESKVVIPLGQLRPVLPEQNGRYYVVNKVQRSHVTVKPTEFLEFSRDSLPSYLPPQFDTATQAEGSVYFYRKNCPRVVTDSNLYSATVAQKISYWIDEAIAEAKRKDLPLNDTVELYLKIEGEDCNYYFVHYKTRTLFWLEDMETSDLGLLPVMSSSHLKWLLETQFWNHVETFSAHSAYLTSADIDELILVFSHGLGDNLTSKTSTFGYDAAACEKFINILKNMRNQPCSTNTVATVARLLGTIAYNRYETHYGQEQARLSRDTSIIESERSEVMTTRTLLSWISAGATDRLLQRLDSLFVDDLLYERDWEDFMSQVQRSWRNVAYASAANLFLHGVPFALPSSHPLAIASGSLSMLGLLSSLALLARHEGIEKAGATAGHRYLKAARSENFNFQGVALSFSIPRILLSASFFLIISQWAMVICQSTDGCYASAFIFTAALLLLFIRYSTSDSPSIFSRFLPARQKDASSIV